MISFKEYLQEASFIKDGLSHLLKQASKHTIYLKELYNLTIDEPKKYISWSEDGKEYFSRMVLNALYNGVDPDKFISEMKEGYKNIKNKKSPKEKLLLYKAIGTYEESKFEPLVKIGAEIIQRFYDSYTKEDIKEVFKELKISDFTKGLRDLDKRLKDLNS